MTNKRATKSKSDTAATFAALTDQLIASIRNDPADWSRPWRDAVAGGLPANATTGAAYSGGNLWSLAMSRPGAGGRVWATYRQWSTAGVQVNRGEHGTPLVRWVRPKCRAGHGKDTRCGACPDYLVPVGFVVFHYGQTTGGYDYVREQWGETPDAPVPATIDHLERFVTATGARITHAEPDRAYYSPKGDFVNLPRLDLFDNAERYYATALHELVHWTGHRSRCNRPGIADFDSFGSEQYAAEELIAELGSVLLGAGVLGLDMPVRDDHAAYLKHWLTVLGANPKFLHRSMTKASAAVTYLTDLALLTDERDAMLASDSAVVS